LASEWNAGGLTTWTYDNAYRRATQRTQTALTSYTYDLADQLNSSVAAAAITTYSYDADGQTTLVQPPTGNPTSYSWDSAHRLKAAVTPAGSRYTYAYDYLDLRVQKQGPLGTESYLWDGSDMLMWQGPSNISELSVRGATLARVVGKRSGNVTTNRQYHTDAMANVEAITDGTQTAEVKPTVDAWGNLLSGSATDQPFDYTGGLGYWHDPDLSLQYVRARWLNPANGQWLSPDPIESEPRYAYAHNMPTTHVDPSGLQSGAAVGIVGGAVGGVLNMQPPNITEMMGYALGQAFNQVRTEGAAFAGAQIAQSIIPGMPNTLGRSSSRPPSQPPTDPLSAGLDWATRQVGVLKEVARDEADRRILRASLLAEQMGLTRKNIVSAISGFLTASPSFLRNWWNQFYQQAPPLVRNLTPDLDPTDGRAFKGDLNQFVEGFIDGLVDGFHDFIVDLVSLPLDFIQQIIDLLRFIVQGGKAMAALFERVKKSFGSFLQFTGKDKNLPVLLRGKILGLLLVAGLTTLFWAAVPGPEGKAGAAGKLEKLAGEAGKVEKTVAEFSELGENAAEAAQNIAKRTKVKKRSLSELTSAVQTDIEKLKEARTALVRQLEERSRRRKLGWDPAKKKYSASEEAVALRLEKRTGTLIRDPSGREDWMDKGRYLYNAVGPVPDPLHFNFESFTASILDHLRHQGLHFVVVDMHGMPETAISQVQHFVDSLPNVVGRPKVIVQW
jgi:RHS repeat-associated protein